MAVPRVIKIGDQKKDGEDGYVAYGEEFVSLRRDNRTLHAHPIFFIGQILNGLKQRRALCNPHSTVRVPSECRPSSLFWSVALQPVWPRPAHTSNSTKES
jgi:hypothetical protein